MEINISKLIGGVSGIVGVILVSISAYFTYTIFSNGSSSIIEPTAETINASLFGEKIQSAANLAILSKQKIAVTKKDLIFVESKLYKSFTESPEDVPLSDSRGRPDPFTPYVAP